MTVTDGRAKCAADGAMRDFMRLKSTARQQKRSKIEVPLGMAVLPPCPPLPLHLHDAIKRFRATGFAGFVLIRQTNGYPRGRLVSQKEKAHARQ